MKAYDDGMEWAQRHNDLDRRQRLAAECVEEIDRRTPIDLDQPIDHIPDVTVEEEVALKREPFIAGCLAAD